MASGILPNFSGWASCSTVYRVLDARMRMIIAMMTVTEISSFLDFSTSTKVSNASEYAPSRRTRNILRKTQHS